MKRILFLLLLGWSLALSAQTNGSHYLGPRAPLYQQPYIALPLGAIEPQGMLREMLDIQRRGLTGNLDEIYSVVCGDNNGWLGGTGDGWERGPYWIDGLLPLAYQLQDRVLIKKAEKWVDWTLENQREDGYIGPKPLPEGYKVIPGTQQGNREDWWPKMVMLKILQQYYTATQDRRVIDCLTKYFRYQLKHLPEKPLGHWTYWGEQRGGDNLAVVYWLYNITGEKFLLELGELIHAQTTPWTTLFTDNTFRRLNPLPEYHCVNVAQGMKEPVIYYQAAQDEKYRNAVREGLSALKDCHGYVNGMYGADEMMHGNDPQQGIELCSIVELMYSLESILPITADPYYADYLEKLAYNVLPTQTNDEYTRKQYFQQANQVEVTFGHKNYFHDGGSRHVYGTTSGYPCCLTNMHQGWPKFVQNLWYATRDLGVAALVYGPSAVHIKAGKSGKEVRIVEETGYPFKDRITFRFEMKGSEEFPFHLRIPQWCGSASLRINGEAAAAPSAGSIQVLNRTWKDGDIVELTLPMEFSYSHWYENSLGIERGPLVYALRIEEEWTECTRSNVDDTYWEVRAKSPWNYALLYRDLKNNPVQIKTADRIEDNPWNLENAPVSVQVKARRIKDMKLIDGHISKMYVSPNRTSEHVDHSEVETVTLIPYGCTTLRISEFPWL